MADLLLLPASIADLLHPGIAVVLDRNESGLLYLGPDEDGRARIWRRSGMAESVLFRRLYVDLCDAGARYDAMRLLADRLDLAVTHGVRWHAVAGSDQHWTLVGDDDWRMTSWGAWATGLRLPMPIPGRVLPDGTPWQAAAALLCTVCHVAGVTDVEKLIVLDGAEVSGG